MEHYQIMYKTKKSQSYKEEQNFWTKRFSELKFPVLDYLSIAKAKDKERCFEYCSKPTGVSGALRTVPEMPVLRSQWGSEYSECFRI